MLRAQLKKLAHVSGEVRWEPGTAGTTSGYEATIVRHYYEGMYEVRVPGGVCCIPACDFIPDEPNAGR